MMENRSFDHLLGWLHLKDSRIDGLTGKESNPIKVSEPHGKHVSVNQDGFDVGPDDPRHGWKETAYQIYGEAVTGNNRGHPKMNGFVADAVIAKHNPVNPMSMFNSTGAPIINTLASEFAVFDRWFCSLPGPTDPNRAFAMSGTSNGVITNFNGTLWSQQSYFDFLTDNNISWRAHYQDDPWAVMYFKDMHTKKNSPFVSELPEFFKELEKGFLPEFTWLQPRMTSHKGAPTWQHPDASLSEGERLIKEVYEKLRASKHWNEVAFIVTYDEHGGFYDHVPPPQEGVPSPDGVKAPNGFEFDRLGIRIPYVVASPWIPKGTVVNKPTGPTPTSEFDGTSTISTANKLFGLTGHLTKRAAWSGTYEHIFSLSKPRTDCPTHLPPVAEYTHAALLKQQALPLNDHMQIQVEFYCKFNKGHGPNCGKNLKNQFQASVFLEREAAIFMENLKQQDI